MTTQRDRNRLADVYTAISNHPGITKTQLEEQLGKHVAADWAVTELAEQGMVTHLKNIPGRHGVESRYATVRQAAELEGKKTRKR